MKLKIDDLPVFFPFKGVYPEQVEYMRELKRTLDSPGHSILEMPTGTGKTVCLLSLIVSYLLAREMPKKLIYCTRTVVEMEKTLQELKFFLSQWQAEVGEKPKLLAVCLSSRRNLCVHPVVSQEAEREKVDSACRARTASWVRDQNTDLWQQSKHLPDIEDLAKDDSRLCGYFERLERKDGGTAHTELKNGVFTLEDLKIEGKKKGYCPYFLARRLIPLAHVVVFNYAYVLDPKIADLVSKEIRGPECVVVFDECHNIDNVCVESMSMQIDRRAVELAAKNIDALKQKLADAKRRDSLKLKIEYQTLVKGLIAKGALSGEAEKALLAMPVQAEGNISVMPGNIRKAEHFLSFLRRLVAYLRQKLKDISEATKQTPFAFTFELKHVQAIDQKALEFTASRLSILLNTLEVENVYDFHGIELVSNFATTLAHPQHKNGFALIQDPFPNPNGLYDPVLQLACLDASIATRPVFTRFRNVVLTSGTVSPFHIYKTILEINPKICRSLRPALPRNCFEPLLVSRGADESAVSSKFDERDDASVVRNYGALLIDLASTVPDGIVAFFPSYLYMERILCRWHQMGVLERLLKRKLLFIEKKDIVQTVLALQNYRKACDCGRGAILLSIARGKVAEGVDFAHHYGRCVVLFGVPFQYSLSRPLRARLEFIKHTYAVSERDFLAFDAIRQAAQCLGRVLRSKSDYGLMILADKRYSRANLLEKLPEWIKSRIPVERRSLSSLLALSYARDFFKEMCQPFSISKKILLDEAAVSARYESGAPETQLSQAIDQ